MYSVIQFEWRCNKIYGPIRYWHFLHSSVNYAIALKYRTIDQTLQLLEVDAAQGV